jgi:ABC-type transporter Mla MlaB component
MLKISEPSANLATTLKLEGRLIGPWVEQLRESCENLIAQEKHVQLDFTDVTFADRRGVALLMDLQNRGVKLLNCSPFLAEELRVGA